jgi:hypothetical protein
MFLSNGGRHPLIFLTIVNQITKEYGTFAADFVNNFTIE